MYTLKDLHKAIEKARGTYEKDRYSDHQETAYTIDAPEGKQWIASQTSVMIKRVFDYTKSEDIKLAIFDVEMGTEEITD